VGAQEPQNLEELAPPARAHTPAVVTRPVPLHQLEPQRAATNSGGFSARSDPLRLTLQRLPAAPKSTLM